MSYGLEIHFRFEFSSCEFRNSLFEGLKYKLILIETNRYGVNLMNE